MRFVSMGGVGTNQFSLIGEGPFPGAMGAVGDDPGDDRLALTDSVCRFTRSAAVEYWVCGVGYLAAVLVETRHIPRVVGVNGIPSHPRPPQGPVHQSNLPATDARTIPRRVASGPGETTNKHDDADNGQT